MRPFALAVVCLLSAAAFAQPHKPIEWSEVEPGLQFARIEATKYVTRGSAFIAALRVDPERFEFQPFHYKDEQLSGPVPIDEWAERIARPVFNAGQYEMDLLYLGALKRDGKALPSHAVTQWKAALVSGPVKSGASGVIDLRDMAQVSALPFRNVIQSFMLRDDSGALRTRRSSWEANRTVVVQQRSGHVVVLTTEGAFTLGGLSDFIGESKELDALRVMSMDGGYEAELALTLPLTKRRYVTFGQWETNDGGDISMPGVHFPLPAVVAIVPIRARPTAPRP